MIDKIFAIVIVIISIGLVIFHILLALGKPYGKAAYGGNYEILPTNLRKLSIIAIGIFFLTSITALIQAGYIILFQDEFFFIVLNWIFMIYSFIMVFANLFSKSKIEKRLMTPLSLILGISFLIILI